MAIAFRAAASGSAANASLGVTVTKPTGVVDNDVMVAFVNYRSATTGTWTGPTGWTKSDEVANTLSSYSVWWKVAASEGASFTWTSSGNNAAGIVIVAYSGAATTGIFDSDGGIATSATATSTPVTSSTTTVADNSVVIAAWMGAAGAARTISSDPAGYTNRAVNTTQATAQVFVDDKLGKTPAGAEGAQTLTLSGNLTAGSPAGILVSLAPPSVFVPSPYYYRLLAGVSQ